MGLKISPVTNQSTSSNRNTSTAAKPATGSQSPVQNANVSKPATATNTSSGISTNSASAGKTKVSTTNANSGSTSKTTLTNNQAAKTGIDTSSYVKSNLNNSTIPPSGLKYGQNNASVGQLQNQYVKLGLMTTDEKATGPNQFGPKTKSATVQLQKSLGVPPSGEFNDETRSAIIDLHTGVIKRGATGEDVMILQQNLVKGGYLKQSEMNTGIGVFGPKTEGALKEFQKNNGVQQTGVFGPTTYKALQDSQNLKTITPPIPTVTTFPASTKNAQTAPGKSNGNIVSKNSQSVADNQLPNTTAEANKVFKTQFKSSVYNTDGPNGSVNCGPTSVAIALEATGVLEPTHSNGNIAAVRKAIGREGLTGAADFVKVVPQFGGSAKIINSLPVVNSQIKSANADKKDALTIAGVKDKAWQAFDAELNKGNALVVQGNISTKYRTDVFNDNSALRGGAKADTYGTVTYDNYPHILAVVGKTKDGSYLVADPMSRSGTVEMTQSQLATLFLKGEMNQNLGIPTNVVSVSNPNTK